MYCCVVICWESKSKLAGGAALVSILPSGSLTLPEHFFCADQYDQNVRNTVPSMSFLLYHEPSQTHVIFDLGMRRDLDAYPSSIHSHLRTRLPIQTIPDVSESLRRGGLEPSEVGAIILSHVHYDHVGTPGDFPNAQFIVGYGTRHLLQNGMKYHSASHFEKDLLPSDRIIELPIQSQLPNYACPLKNSFPPIAIETLNSRIPKMRFSWKSLPPFPNTMDLFGDGYLYIVDSPGHLPGHLNVLARVSANQWVYLAGDSCHSARILCGETQMAIWEENGQTVCIHADRELASETLGRIRQIKCNGLDGAKVEVVLAHDAKWLEEHQGAIFPGRF
ncbi:beta-lactamase-like protein [Bisporella sp. PMI_857]|nr:beta-lactamase-like protein [Bisporella sp. PMI_857]